MEGFIKKYRKKIKYTKTGCININGIKLNLCDCLEKDCPGCFFKCENCSSNKCGVVCRVGRTYMVDYIEQDGKPEITMNPYLYAKQ